MKILLTGAYNFNQEQIGIIRELGFETDFIQYENDVLKSYAEYDGVICNGLFLYHDINKFERLKYIQLTSAGFDRVPMKYVSEKNIRLYNAAGVYSIPIAEYTVSKILEFYKKSREFYRKQYDYEWDKERNISELYGKKVAIIGCGNIGKEIAKRLFGFGVEILGVDIKNVECEYISRCEKLDRINNILEESDIVILTLPFNDNTNGLINLEKLKQMKQNAILINVSRGKVVVQNDLIMALNSKLIAGAVLDVFEEEPLSPQSELWEMKNVIITPHNSFVGEGNNKRMFDVIYKNLKEWIQGGII